MNANAEMKALWNGEQTASWVSRAQQYDAMLEPLGAAALAAASLAPGERVLDVGCGTGALARAAAAAVEPGGSVVGVDVAAPLLELARQRGPSTIDYREADAQVADLGTGVFDVVISRFGVMFFDDPRAAFANLARAVVPGGRLSFVCWQPLLSNPWALTAVLAVAEHVPLPTPPGPGEPGPFAFGDPQHVTDVLTDAGWQDVRCEAHQASIAPYGARTAQEAATGYADDAFGRALLGGADAAGQERALAALTEALRPFEGPDGVRLESATWIVTARAASA